MRQKLVIALSLLFAFTLLFSAQLSYANSNHEDHDHDRDDHHKPPVTTPVTGPVTGPITSPVSLFRISGKVTDHIWRLFKRGADRLMPEAGVKVKAKDVFNGQSATAITDSNGSYVITVAHKGYYKVTVVNGDANFYLPPFNFAHLTDSHPTQSHVDFEGFNYHF